MTQETGPGIISAHHAGISVADIDAALKFWEGFLGYPARWRTVLDKPYLGRIVGYPGIAMDAAFIDLPGGLVIELLQYRTDDKRHNSDITANPGNVHICLQVKDCRAAWQRAVDNGARPITPDGPVEISHGPNTGARGAYLRIHDGVTLEVLQRPPPAEAAA
jgi:catechol 2,3-dioxygenase-like lactoylglutathione lyase family enzyme